jgi:hypothetical protein
MLRQEVSSMGDRWYVTNGVVAVGPLGFDLLTRGVAHGRIPNGSLVRHESWKVWRPLQDIEGLTESDLRHAVEHFGGISAQVEARASSPTSEAPPPPSEADLDADLEPRESAPSRPTIRPPAVDPVGVLASASNLDEAFLLALSTSVTAAAAKVGLWHRSRGDLGSVVTEYAQGPGAELLLGERLREDDPCLLAARAGHTVMGEPRLGEAGRHVAGRVGRCIASPRAVAMVPLCLFGRFVAMLELGRAPWPFRACEIARVEDVVEALAERIVVAGWLD